MAAIAIDYRLKFCKHQVRSASEPASSTRLLKIARLLRLVEMAIEHARL